MPKAAIENGVIMKYLKPVFALSILVLSMLAVSAQKDASSNAVAANNAAGSKDNRPMVVLFRADWCPYCKALEPKFAKLMAEYDDRLRFVVFDITNAETTEKAADIARSEAISEYFEAKKDKASTLAILKDGKEIFSIVHTSDRDQIAAAFDAVLSAK